MRESKAFGLGLVTLLFVAACGGGPAATQGPGAATQGPGAATQGPGGGTVDPGAGATTDPGGRPVDGGGSGQIHIELGGPIQESVDQPFFAVGSRFGGQAGTALNFTTADGTGIAAINEVNGVVIVSWVTDDAGYNSSTCTTSNWNIGATSGSGEFDCTDGFGTKTDGTFLSGITMKGSFQASL